jgi:hypothetical protein
MEGTTMLRGLITGFVLLLFSSTVVLAQRAPCFPTVDFERLIKKQYKEQKAWMGFPPSTEAQERVIILYENEETRSWTIGLYMPKKDIICFIAAGSDFIHIEPKPVTKKGTKL